MKTLTPLLIALAFVTSNSAINAEGLYKWKDARGNIQYGDKPPTNVKAEAFDLPKITVIDNYADQWKPMKFDEAQAPITQNIAPKTQVKTSVYSKLSFLAPKSNQAIRANDGDVSAMVSIKPPLKKGHKIIFSIDGKAFEEGTSRTQNFANLKRGAHNVAVKIVDNKGKTLKSNSVNFNVLRTSSLSSTKSNQAPKQRKATTFNAARQNRIQNSN